MTTNDTPAPRRGIVAAWLANHFEQNRANLQLINQREQAESSLRATTALRI